MADTLQLNSLFQMQPMMNPVRLPVDAHRTEAYLRGSKAPEADPTRFNYHPNQGHGQGTGVVDKRGAGIGKEAGWAARFLQICGAVRHAHDGSLPDQT